MINDEKGVKMALVARKGRPRRASIIQGIKDMTKEEIEKLRLMLSVSDIHPREKDKVSNEINRTLIDRAAKRERLILNPAVITVDANDIGFD